MTSLRPRTCPSAGAKLCTYCRWFSRPGPVSEPYFELPLSSRNMRRLFRFRLSAHSLPIEVGRRLKGNNNTPVPRFARTCPLCPGRHVGDERHLVFECPAFAHIRRQHAQIYRNSQSTMRLFMWHPDQKGVASCLLRLLSEYDSVSG